MGFLRHPGCLHAGSNRSYPAFPPPALNLSQSFFRCSFFLILTLLVLAVFPWVKSVAAQTPEGRTIVSLEVNSKVGMTIQTLSRLTGIRTGIPYSEDIIRGSLDALYSTELFTNIIIEAELLEHGVAVIFNLTERTRVAQVKIKGNRVFKDKKIKEVLNLRPGEEFTESRWKLSLEGLLEFLHGKGFLLAMVQTTVSEIRGTNQVRIILQVNEGARTKIGALKFTGNPAIPNLNLRATIHLKLKRAVYYHTDYLKEDLVHLRELYDRKGYFKAKIGPAEFSLNEKTNVVNITIPIEAGFRLVSHLEGLEPFTQKDIAPLLLFGKERDYDQSVFEASADRILKFYTSKGYPFAGVDFERKEIRENNTLLARFKVIPGSFACLRTILFVGNTFFSSETLRGLLQVREGNLLFCGTLDPEIISRDSKVIKKSYLQEGFQDIQIETQFQYNSQKTMVNLIFSVAEGPRSLITGVEFEGNEAILTDELLKNLELQPGVPFDTFPARRDLDGLLSIYGNKGYLYSEITTRLTFTEDRSGVSIRYLVNEGPLVRFGSILISGNTFTRENVIRREVLFKTGDPYTEDAIQRTRREIQKLGILGNIKLQPVVPIDSKNPETVKDLRIKVRELSKMALDFGVGYADEERLRGFAQATHRNLWGTGRSLRLRAQGSARETKYSTTYTEPWALGRDMTGQIQVFKQTLIRDTYETVSYGAKVGLVKDLTARLRTGLEYEFENNRFRNVTAEEEFLEEDQRANVASLNPFLTWDTRDNPFNPTSGFIQKLVFRDAALILGSQVQFVKTTVQSSWFFPLTQWSVLAISARGGFADRFGETKTTPIFGEVELVPLNERFFVGGRNTVRGYAQDELGILGKTIDENGEAIGGNAMLVFNTELRISLPLGLGLVLFHDRGNVFRTRANVNLRELKSTVGGGLWFKTPVGPLRLDYGYKLDREENRCSACPEPEEESRSEIHFTLGFAF